MYIEEITTVTEELKANPNIVISQLDIGSPATDDEIDAFEMVSGIYLPNHIKDFYKSLNGFTCVWLLKEGLETAMIDSVREEIGQQDFDFSMPLGAVKILPLQDMLLNTYFDLPYQQAPDAGTKITFRGKDFLQGDFAARLRLFDYYDVSYENEATALFTGIKDDEDAWFLLRLNDNMVNWRESQLVDLKSYISAICETKFVIPARKRLFHKKFLDEPILITGELLPKPPVASVLF
jgi:hypothetical protein